MSNYTQYKIRFNNDTGIKADSNIPLYLLYIQCIKNGISYSANKTQFQNETLLQADLNKETYLNWLIANSTESSSIEHNDTIDRDAANSHPISAITDLQTNLDRITTLEDTYNICKTFIYLDHFYGRASNTANTTSPTTGFLFATTGGTFSTSTSLADTGRRGVLAMSTSTSINTKMGAVSYITMLLQDGSTIFATSLKTPSDLSSLSQRYIVMTGLMDDIAASANHCRFKYSDDVNSGKWQIETCNATTQTTTDSLVSVVANTWYKLVIVLNSDATEALYYINNVLVATVTTNIPAANVVHYMTTMNKTAGSSPRVLYVDYHYLKQTYNTEIC